MNDSNIIWRILGISRILYNQRRSEALLQSINKYQKELYYAQLFSDSIKDSIWFINKTLSPSGWAMNYASLYFLYRALDKMNPKNILEFGLGQSSKLIHQYVKYYTDSKAVTYEHDSSWANFFMNEINDKYNINICDTEVEEQSYKQFQTLSYKDNCTELKNQKFDMIVIDGPYGSEHYSRSQILNLLPHCLMSSFCIMMHDSERDGEQETIVEMKKILDMLNIKYSTKTISSNKDMYIICSDDLKFLLTL